MSIQEIATFVEAAEQGSMAGASRALGIPTSTVSRRIHRLEDELGAKLVEVHSRLFRLTEVGDALLRRSSSAVRDLRDALHAVRDGGNGLRGQLSITVAQDLGASAPMAELLAAFRAEHPEVELLIDLDDRPVDLTAEGIDFAFRIHSRPLKAQGSLMTRALGPALAGMFASPAYVAEHGSPQTVEQLADHTTICPSFVNVLSFHQRSTGRKVDVELTSPVQSTSVSFMAPAARANMGIAPVSILVADPFVQRGELVRVLPDWHMASANMSLLWPGTRLPSPRRRTFLDFVVQHTANWNELLDVHPGRVG